ncbi:MAG: Sua5/YciO/YrdC/YwlC family protein, partial [Acidimicrobiia bacterium]|nr:Sua5/YciO/YrdC/YwlC family protein [Acidimicrobiia bacterium]
MDRRVGRSRRARDAHQLLVKQSVIEQGDGDNDLDIERAASLLRSDALVAFPTETVYGLGCNARSTTAISRLYAVKSRPTNHPVIVHLALDAPIDEWAVRVPDWANVLA